MSFTFFVKSVTREGLEVSGRVSPRRRRERMREWMRLPLLT